MLDHHAPDVLSELDSRLSGPDAKADDSIPSGKEAVAKVWR
jgi:hypothetical protein